MATYSYDAQGRRKSKAVGTTTAIYVSDADNREVLDYDGSSGAVQGWYSYGSGPDAVLNRMNLASNSRVTLIPDRQGSIIGVLDSSGVLTKTGYQSFGQSPGLVTSGYHYTAHRFDPESGLYYYRARMYSTAWGRFTKTYLDAYASLAPMSTCADCGMSKIA